MVWQRAGTVAVQTGSTTVIGTNVDFAASSRNGDSFVGPDGATYELSNVASSTVISILPAYKGPTVSGAAYAIMPVQGYDKMLSDAFNNLNNLFGPKLAALGTTGNYDTLPVSKGGTGGTTGRDALINLGIVLVSTGASAPGDAFQLRGGSLKLRGESLDHGSYGAHYGWNGSTGEQYWICNRGSGAGGFSWRTVNGDNTATGPSMIYSYDGVLSVPTIRSTNPISVASGGTGGGTAESARANLQLGTASTLAAGSAPGNVMLVGDVTSPAVSTINTFGNSFQIWSASTIGAPEASTQGTIINAGYNSTNYGSQILMSFTGRMYFRSGTYVSAPMREIYHTGNTTRGSGGALSAASPIVRIADVGKSQRNDLREQQFEVAGEWGVANDEARGVTVERLGVGEYRVIGSLGLALEGWRTQDPCSPDGGRTLGVTESEQADDGSIVIRLYKQRWTLTDDGEMVPGRGAPIDVPLNSWIDARLNMPIVASAPPPEPPKPPAPPVDPDAVEEDTDT